MLFLKILIDQDLEDTRGYFIINQNMKKTVKLGGY
jgi:hypothetical protein